MIAKDLQLALALDWGREPWDGRSPRSLTRGSCGVDNSDVRCTSREAPDVGDPAQWLIFLEGKPFNQFLIALERSQ